MDFANDLSQYTLKSRVISDKDNLKHYIQFDISI